LKFVFRHFPLATMHPLAVEAAVAAEAAASHLIFASIFRIVKSAPSNNIFIYS
jgi:hypothetical protein